MAHITTTAGETFTHAESAEMARLILKRWGNDVAAAASAWRRLMQNNCTDEAFARLLRLEATAPTDPVMDASAAMLQLARELYVNTTTRMARTVLSLLNGDTRYAAAKEKLARAETLATERFNAVIRGEVQPVGDPW